MFRTLTEITGFESYEKIIKVLDSEGKIFYFMKNPTESRITFNMPSGRYNFESFCVALERPLTYKCPDLPVKEKNINVVENLEIILCSNPNKMSFENQIGRMKIDYSFLDKTIPERRFVMGHELGHNYYFSEDKCDYYSAYTMLSEGYNPSQCFYANTFCLSANPNNDKRKEKLLSQMLKVKCYE